MKFLFINYELPPLGGGGGRANAQIARQMAALGHEVKIITSQFSGLPKKEMRDGYEIIRIPSPRRYREKCRIFEMAAFMGLALFYGVYWARKFRPDRTIAFFTIPSAPAALLIKKIFGVPYIVSLRGGDVPGFMKERLWFYHGILSGLIRYIWKEASSVVANSEGLKNLAQKTRTDVDILMIPNGVDSHFFVEKQSGPVDHNRPFRFLTVGRLTTQKGIDDLLLAFYQAKARTARPLQLWIVGDGPERSHLEGLATHLQIQDEVFFLGWQEPETLRNLYASADLFVLSSHYEGMPNVLLEAMAVGLPVLATDVDGSRDLVRENGVLVPARNIGALADGLCHMMEADLPKMGSISQVLSKRYDWQEVAAGYLELCGSSPS